MYKFVDHLHAFRQACENKLTELDSKVIPDSLGYEDGVHDAIAATLQQISDKLELTINDKALTCSGFNIFAANPEVFLRTLVDETQIMENPVTAEWKDVETHIRNIFEELEDLTPEEQEDLPRYCEGMEEGSRQFQQEIVPALFQTYTAFLPTP